MAADGEGLRAGDVVLSGGLTAAVPVAAGDVVVASIDRLGTLELAVPLRRSVMPLVQITLARGRTPEQLQALGEAVTAAVEESIGAPRENVRVVAHECEPEHWFVGGESLAELRASGRR